MIPLDRNESYWLLSDELVKKFTASGREQLSTYPDYVELKKDIAVYAEVDPAQICVTPGSDAAIQIFAQAYVGKDGEAILPVPTFYGYESILDRIGSTIIPVTYTEEKGVFVFPLQETLEALRRPFVKALFLCQPNNPLGCSIPEEDLIQLLRVAKENNVLLVSDEAYFEFSEKTLLPLLPQMDNLLIVRTFSKGFGLSGARVGYCIGAPKYIKKMEELMLPWPIAHQSVFAVQTALAHSVEVTACLEKVRMAREKFSTSLAEITQINVYPSETNFVLIRVPDASKMAQALLEDKIKVALGSKMSRFPEAKKLLSQTLRIAIPSAEDEHVVVNSIAKSLFTR